MFPLLSSAAAASKDDVAPPPAALSLEVPQRAADSAASAIEIVDLLMRIGHCLRGALSSHFAEFHLTDIRYYVLQAISRSAGGCSQTQLADELGQSESSISTLIERMRAGDLVYRLRSTDDRRRWVLLLTARGRELLDQVEQCHGQRMATLLRSLTAEQQSHLSRLLRAVQNQLADFEGGLELSRPSSAPVAASPAA